MRKETKRRLRTVEVQREQAREAAETETQFVHASFILVAYHLGGLQPGESYLEAYAKGLGLRDLSHHIEEFVRALQTGDPRNLVKLNQVAFRKLFTKFSYLWSSPPTYQQAIMKMAAQLPAHCKKLLEELREKAEADFDKRPRLPKEFRNLIAVLEWEAGLA